MSDDRLKSAIASIEAKLSSYDESDIPDIAAIRSLLDSIKGLPPVDKKTDNTTLKKYPRSILDEFIKDGEATLLKKKDGNWVYRKTILPEQKYVRRTTEEFAAGAKPVRGTGSHRMKRVGFQLSFELIDELQKEANAQGVSISDYYRASIRKALRDNMDVEFENKTPITIYDENKHDNP
ncbi:MAG: hypothetical protein COA69_08610 [Robiginitomaculum sp.]|nr:MAG: hypothetical protein COA69_08610 [Robiginitomaculum sp.]